MRIIKKKIFFENQKLFGSAVGLDKKNFLLFLETQKLYGSADGLWTDKSWENQKLCGSAVGLR